MLKLLHATHHSTRDALEGELLHIFLGGPVEVHGGEGTGVQGQ